MSSSSSSSSSAPNIQANLTSCVSCIAFKTWSRMNSKSRNSEIKYLQTRPSRIAVSKFADVNPQIQENIAEFMKTRTQKKRFSSTLGKKSKELNEEEKQARENLVNHLSTLTEESGDAHFSETVEMDVPRRLLKKSKGDEKKKEKERGEKKREKDEFIGGDDDKDTIDGFDETEFEFEPAQASAPVMKKEEEKKPKTSLFDFDQVKEDEEEDDEDGDDDDHLSDEESVHSKFNVALEARKRKVGKISPKEFQNIFEILVDDILQENFHINPAEPFEDTMLRTILSSDLFWSTLFKRMDEVTEKEKESKVDDKLVLYIRNHKK